MKTIVVGVDGSPGSVAALRFAIEEAQTRRAEIRAVNAWHIPAAAYGSGVAPAPVSLSDFEQLGTTALASALKEVAPSVNGVKITSVVREGDPTDVLIDEAKDAELLVVGSRGLGGVRGLLLGSVSNHCTQHAPCPVVVIPHEE